MRFCKNVVQKLGTRIESGQPIRYQTEWRIAPLPHISTVQLALISSQSLSAPEVGNRVSVVVFGSRFFGLGVPLLLPV